MNYAWLEFWLFETYRIFNVNINGLIAEKQKQRMFSIIRDFIINIDWQSSRKMLA